MAWRSSERIVDALTILQLFGGPGGFLRFADIRSSDHLDRAFTRSIRPPSEGLQYTARVLYGVHCVLGVLTLKIRSKVMPSFLSQRN